MKSSKTIESLTDELLEALDQEAGHLQKVTEFLATLSRLIMKRDEAGLRELFCRVHDETVVHQDIENRRYQLIASIAEITGCKVQEITLSMLEKLVPDSYRQHVIARKRSLKQIIDSLRKQHYSTTMLLSEMVRINRSLLAGITGGCSSMTYGRGGQARWSGADNILNLRY